MTWTEPTWVGGDSRSGPLLFLSPVDAEIFRLRRNSKIDRDDPTETDNWKRISLNKFDLFQHVMDCNGTLECNLAFGLSATLRGEIIAPKGTPRMIYAPIPFTLPKGSPRTTFSFNGWVLDFIRDQWKIIGATNYAEQLDDLNALDSSTISAIAKEAMSQVSFTRSESDDTDWGVFLPDTMQWRMGPPEERQSKTSFH
ncbi:hypothetical protein [Collimonas arenae]|uniref:hypothetical protein n=1 Tax=Collimonas arenae TaxID=279058 RepID=UPI0012E03104|nr:hypothetical protein [Collimonas arenae]